MKKELYAFWKSDLFPFVLGGTITDMGADGCVEIESYGKGYWFRPIMIVPAETGKRIAMELKQLRERYLNAKIDLEHKFLDQRDAILKLPV